MTPSRRIPGRYRSVGVVILTCLAIGWGSVRSADAFTVYIGNDSPSGCSGCGGESGAQCTNAIDDDGDGSINGGCPAKAAPGHISWYEHGDQCWDNLDNDDANVGGPDGFVNDGCPPFDSFLTLDTATDDITGRHTLGVQGQDAEEFNPVAGVAGPDGRRVYLVGERNVLSVIDTATNHVVETIQDFGASGYGSKAISVRPDGCALYVTSSLQIAVVDVASGSTLGNLDTSAFGSVFVSFDKLAMSPVGNHAYVSALVDDAYVVLAIDTQAHAFVGNPIAFDTVNEFQPEHMVVSPNGQTLYVGDERTGRVAIVNTAAGTVTKMVDSAPGFIIIGGLGELVVSPDGGHVYFANQGDIFIIDTSTNTLEENPIHTGAGGLNGIIFLAISPDGSHLYAAGDEGPSKMYVIDTSSKTVSKTIDRGDYFGLGPIVPVPAATSLPACVSATTTTTQQGGTTTTTQQGATTTTQTSATTTSTTTPSNACATAHDCLVGLQAATICSGETLKSSLASLIDKKLASAIANLTKAAAGGPSRKVKAAAKKASGALKLIQTKAAKGAAKKKNPPISGACRDRLDAALAPAVEHLNASQF